MKPLLPLSSKERAELFKLTAATPLKIEKLLQNLTAEQLLQKSTQGFSLHEHVWHLADLEQDGFSKRIELLLQEEHVVLPDFPGDKIAMERNYQQLPLAHAFKQFSRARLHNLWTLSGLKHIDWMRQGQQEGVGNVRLVDIFRAMAEHDVAHLQEIAALLNKDFNYQPTKPVAA